MDIPYSKETYEKAKWFFATKDFDPSLGENPKADHYEIGDGVGMAHLKDENKIRVSFYKPGTIYIP